MWSNDDDDDDDDHNLLRYATIIYLSGTILRGVYTYFTPTLLRIEWLFFDRFSTQIKYIKSNIKDI